MKEKSVLIITLALLLLAFIASTMGSAVTGAITYQQKDNFVSCGEDLPLMEGRYIVPCVEGKLQWGDKITTE